MPNTPRRFAVGLAAVVLGAGLLTATPAAAESIAGDYTYIANGDGTATLTRYDGPAVDVAIPSNIGGLSVTAIGDYAFQGPRWGYRLESVNIPSTVTSIGQFAFDGNGLTSLTIPDSVTKIGISAFGLNTELTTVKLSNSMTEIPDLAFYNAPLTSVTIPASVRTIKPYVFVGPALSDVTFLGNAPQAVTGAGSSRASFIGSQALKIHYDPATSGWSNPWNGYTTIGDFFGIAPDSDRDGLSDDLETNGLDSNDDGIVDLDLPAMGADPGRADIFLEVDWMEKPPTCFFTCWGADSWQPDHAGLQGIVQAFADQGVSLHIDAGLHSLGSLNSGGNAIPWTATLGTSSGDSYNWSAFEALKESNLDAARRGVFHYAIFVDKFGQSTDQSTGMSRTIPGRDLIVAEGFLRGYGGHTPRTQSGTLMHELGHNLGLRHGGPDDTKYQMDPSYRSVMNYAYQLGAGYYDGPLDPNDPGLVDYSDGSPFNDWAHLWMEDPAGQFGFSGPPVNVSFVDEITEQYAVANDLVAAHGDGSIQILGPNAFAAGASEQVVHARIFNPSSAPGTYRVSAALNGAAAPVIVQDVPAYSQVDMPIVFDATAAQVGNATLEVELWSETLPGLVDSVTAALVGLDTGDPLVSAKLAEEAILVAALPDAPPPAVLQTLTELAESSEVPHIAIAGGDAQSQTIEKPFFAPLEVFVSDDEGIPMEGQDVVFLVTSGSASFNGDSSTTVRTSADGTAAATLTAGGTPGPVSVTAKLSGAEESAAVTFTGMVEKWNLNGFFHPVDMNGVWNVVKGGSTVPLKFEVWDGSTELTNISAIDEFVVKGVACPSGPVGTDAIELTTTGLTSLRYDTDAGQFVQNWRTPKVFVGCVEVSMKTLDGSTLNALFELK